MSFLCTRSINLCLSTEDQKIRKQTIQVLCIRWTKFILFSLQVHFYLIRELTPWSRLSNLLLFALLPPAFSWISPRHIHVFVGMRLPCLTNYYADHHSQLWSDPWNSSNISFSRLRQSLLKIAINCINKLFIKGLISKQLNSKTY